MPPSIWLLSWEIMHMRVPTDYSMRNCGCINVSACCLCQDHEETTQHLLFSYTFANIIKYWLKSKLQINFTHDNLESILACCSSSWSLRVYITIFAPIGYSLWNIWRCRNSLRLDNHKISLQATITSISSSINMVISNCKGC